MVKLVAVVALFAVLAVAAHAQQYIVNPDMDGCGTSTGRLTSWSGSYSTSSPFAASVNPQSAGFALANDPGPGACAAAWTQGSTAITQALNVPQSLVREYFVFQTYYGCAVASGTGTCRLELKFGGVIYMLSNSVARKTVTGPTGSYSLVETPVSLRTRNDVVSISCITTGGARCFIAKATLTLTPRPSPEPARTQKPIPGFPKQ